MSQMPPNEPPSADLPPLGGWNDGPPAFEPTPAHPPTAGGPRPPTELPRAWAPAGPAEPPDPRRPSGRGPLIGALIAVVSVMLLAFGIGALVLVRHGDVSASSATTTAPDGAGPVPSVTEPASATTTVPGEGLGGRVGEEPTGATTPESGGGASTTAAGAATTAPVGTEGDADARAQVDDIVAFIERTRQTTFDERPTVRFADDAAFQQALLADFDDDAPELRREQVLLHALGLLDTDIDLAASLKAALGAGVVGFYDPETKEMLVRGTELTPYVRTVVAHELTHALDDQLFGLDRPKLDKARDERGFGFTVLTEGSASWVERQYRSSMSSADRAAVSTEELQAGSDPALFQVPIVVLTLLTAPYSQGPELVADVLRAESSTPLPETFAQAFAEPPTTSEETMTPAKYLSHEGSVRVAIPKTGGKRITQGVFGQIGFTALLTRGLALDDPAPGTEGWAGDRYATWNDGADRPCVRINTRLDSPSDARDLQSQLEAWAVDATVDAAVTASGRRVTLRSCALTPAGGTASGV